MGLNTVIFTPQDVGMMLDIIRARQYWDKSNTQSKAHPLIKQQGDQPDESVTLSSEKPTPSENVDECFEACLPLVYKHEVVKVDNGLNVAKFPETDTKSKVEMPQLVLELKINSTTKNAVQLESDSTINATQLVVEGDSCKAEREITAFSQAKAESNISVENDIINPAVQQERNVIVHSLDTTLNPVEPHVPTSSVAKPESPAISGNLVTTSSMWTENAFDDTIQLLEVIEYFGAEKEERPRKKKGLFRRAIRKIRKWLKK